MYSPIKIRVAHGLIWGQVGRLAEVALQFAFSFLVIRELPVAEYGTYGLVMGLALSFLLATSLGLGDSVRRFLPQYAAGPEPGQARSLLDRLLLVRLATIAGCGVIFLLAYRFIFGWVGVPATIQLTGIVLLLGAAMSFDELLGSALTAVYDLRTMYRVRVWIRIFNLGAALALLRLRALTFQDVLLILLTSQAAGVLVFLGLRHRAWKLAQRSVVEAAGAVRFGLTAWSSQVLTFILEARSDVLLLGLLIADPRQVAFYNAGMLALLAPLSVVMTAPNSLALPAFSEARARGGDASLAKAVESFWKLSLVCGLPICLFGAVFAEPIVLTVFGARYTEAAPVMRMVAIMGVFSTLLGQGVLPGLVYALDRQRTDLKIRMVSAAINISLALLLIPRRGAVGAVLATAIAALAVFAAEGWLTRRSLSYQFPSQVALKVLLVSALLCAAVWAFPLVGLAQMAVAAASFGIAFMVLLSFVKVLDARDRAILGSMKNPLVRFVAARY